MGRVTEQIAFEQDIGHGVRLVDALLDPGEQLGRGLYFVEDDRLDERELRAVRGDVRPRMLSTATPAS